MRRIPLKLALKLEINPVFGGNQCFRVVVWYMQRVHFLTCMKQCAHCDISRTSTYSQQRFLTAKWAVAIAVG